MCVCVSLSLLVVFFNLSHVFSPEFFFCVQFLVVVMAISYGAFD